MNNFHPQNNQGMGRQRGKSSLSEDKEMVAGKIEDVCATTCHLHRMGNQWQVSPGDHPSSGDIELR
jgi:hypothetical protein